MAGKVSKKSELIQELGQQGRAMSAATIMFHQAVAQHAGLSGTDHKYMDVLLQNGSMTAGELARRCNLTTGAITGIVDRLEKAGLVTRARSNEDRRQVLLVVNQEEAMRRLYPVFQRLSERLEQQFSNYKVKDLELISQYLTETREILEQEADSLVKSSPSN